MIEALDMEIDFLSFSSWETPSLPTVEFGPDSAEVFHLPPLPPLPDDISCYYDTSSFDSESDSHPSELDCDVPSDPCPQKSDVKPNIDSCLATPISELKSIIQPNTKPLQPEQQQSSMFVNPLLLSYCFYLQHQGIISTNGSNLPTMPQQQATGGKDGKTKREKKFFCRPCGKAYTTKYHWSMHMNKHTGTTYPCPEPGCKKEFTHKKYLQAHKKSHNRTKTEMFPCSFCGKDLTDWRNLKNHSESFHHVVITRKPTQSKKQRSKPY